MPFSVVGSARGALAASAGLGLLVLTCAAARAVPTYAVSFDDPGGSYSAYYEPIAANVRAAGAEWASAFGATGTAAIAVRVDFGANPTATGSSVTSRYVGRDSSSGIAVYEQGAASRLKGDAPPSSGGDIRITIGASYLTSELWFDPAPATPGEAVPASKTDAYSVFLHELGHAYAFNGWRDADGALPGDYQSSFDRWVVRRGGDLFFEGPRAVLAYGGPVPLTRGNYVHLGNAAGLPGDDLIADLMGGVSFLRGTRYAIGALDLAIAADAGLSAAAFAPGLAGSPSRVVAQAGPGAGLAVSGVAIPEPPPLAVFAAVWLAAVASVLLPRRRPGAR